MLLVKICSFGNDNPGELKDVEISGYAQGTTYHIVYYVPDSNVVRKQTDGLLSGLDRSVSLYVPESLICRFNRSGKGITIDQTCCVLVKKAMEVSRATREL